MTFPLTLLHQFRLQSNFIQLRLTARSFSSCKCSLKMIGKSYGEPYAIIHNIIQSKEILEFSKRPTDIPKKMGDMELHLPFRDQVSSICIDHFLRAEDLYRIAFGTILTYGRNGNKGHYASN